MKNYVKPEINVQTIATSERVMDEFCTDLMTQDKFKPVETFGVQSVNEHHCIYTKGSGV